MRTANERPGAAAIPGDIVYFQHPEHGPLSGRVHAAGRDGCQIAHETSPTGYHKVPWDSVLGHKQRHVRKLKIVERGEDGHIAVDERGQRVFVEGGMPEGEEEDEEEVAKAFEPLGQPVLVDIGHVHAEGCNHALEGLYKALSGEDGAAFDIWEAHPNSFIAALVEKFSQRGLTKISSVQVELAKWIAGDHHVPHKNVQPVPPGYMGRWTQPELDLVRIYLESLAEPLGYDDWSLLVDYLVQRYLPEDALKEEAEWLATKANLMGRMQGHLDMAAPMAAGMVAEALPGTTAEALHMFSYSDVAASIMEYGRVHACEQVTAFSEGMRHRLKRTILDYEQQRLAGENVSLSSLQTDLFDAFDYLNRDWRRIAITEAGEMANQGVIAALPRDSKVRRIEAYNGACPFCRKLDGRIFRVTTADDPEKDGFADVWPGKTNVGRSASPMKRVGGQLVARDPDERWWAAAGTQHPHCRGRWEPVEAKPGEDPAFAAWLKKRLGQVEGMEP